MTINGFERVFTNNGEYENFKAIPFLDSLAYTVQEFLYSDRAKDERQDYRMDTRIKLFDFMTIAYFFIDAVDTGLGRATIKGYIEDMKQYKYSSVDDERIEYEKEGLIISRASNELISALLWVTYLYANAIAQLPNSDLWKEGAQMLYDLMKEYSSCTEESFTEHLLIRQTRDALCLMISHLQKRAICDTSQQQKTGEEPHQEEETKANGDVAEEITLHDKVRLDLLLRLMKNDGANTDKHGNKTIAAQLMQSITGLPLQTCKNYCSNRDLNVKTHSEEVLKMNTLLQALGMKIRL